MAPMAGVTTRAFRRSVRRWGAGLLFTEMISSCGIHYGSRRTFEYLDCGDDEHPIGFQLFGADPALMAEAAVRCVEAGADLVDLNMACPVRKVVKTGSGAALLADPAAAAAVAAAVVGAVGGSVPVTAKIRAGLREGDDAGRRTAHALVEAGVAAVCLHPRTAAQFYRGTARHELTSALAAELPVPVIASGDVDGRPAVLARLADGAAAVMLARHALGAPWLFAEVLGEAAPSTAERLAELRRFVAEVFEEMGPRGVGYLRRFWPSFRRSATIDRVLATEVMTARSPEEVERLLARPSAVVCPKEFL